METARSSTATGPEFDALRWRSRMQESDIADELFLPIENGDWFDTRFRIVRSERAMARTRITGVRFLAADPQRENLEPERAVQNDFHRLLDSLIKVRSRPGCEGLQLSRETFRTSPRREVPRLRFGLERRKDSKPPDETASARASYRAIRRAIGRAGFVVEDPQRKFDARTGFVGLQAWTDELRLRKRRMWWLWLLLLPLLLLIPKCETGTSFFGAPIETDSFILLIDRSGSMEAHFASLQRESQRVVDQLIERGSSAMDVIAYAGSAESALGSVQPIDAAVRTRIVDYLTQLDSGGGTNLRSGLELAAQEIAAHGEPTTLIILTDAEDNSIEFMVRESQDLLAQFGDIEIHGYGLTPRLFGPPAEDPVQPENNNERSLSELSELLGGRFGPTRGAR